MAFFVILMLLTLILVVVGFLRDSAFATEMDHEQPEPPTRKALALYGLFDLLFMAAWIYWGLTEYGAVDVDKWQVAICLVASIFLLLSALNHFRKALAAS